MITGFLLCTAFISFANETGKDQSPLESFEFVAELGKSAISLESRHGTSWLTLTWGTSGGLESNFWIDDAGVAGRESSMSGHNFLLHVKVTPEKIEFKSKHGTSWKELSHSTNESQRLVVNEYGIQKEVAEH